MASFKVTIISPAGEHFRGEASRLTLPGAEGGFTFLPGHAPLLALLRAGTITVKNTQTYSFTIKSGFVQFLHNTALVLVEDAQKGA